jgi:methionine synthase I (cobalamin-dependent)
MRSYFLATWRANPDWAKKQLKPRLRRVNVLGGCCGTDQRHVAQVCSAWQASG